MAKGEIFGQLPGWAKGVVAVAIVGGVGFIAFRIYKEIKSVQEKKDFKEEANSIKNELDNLNTSPETKQTISKATAMAMANAIFAAMDGIGTDITAISKQLLQLKNQADWLALSSAYGVRKLNSGIMFIGDFTGTLLASFANEFGHTDVPYTNQLNKFFKSKNINAVV